MIKYLGSKRTLVHRIVEVASCLPEVTTALDLFSGTARVGHALKSAGFKVHSNDHNRYAYTLATCYVQCDLEDHMQDMIELLEHLNHLEGKAGYITETFCERSHFFKPKNGARIDAIREEIEHLNLDEERKAIALVSLMEAADRVDSTTGVQMAYLKSWAPRASNDLKLRMPNIVRQAVHGKGTASQLDALDGARQLRADLAYLDPPYNQHKYLGNYHIWESLVLWDKPEVYGVACKRIDCKERTSDFNSKRRAFQALENVIREIDAHHLIISFSDEGFIDRSEMEALLASRGSVIVLEQDFKRYVGAQIGIYNPSGNRVGQVSHLRNTEYLYIVTPQPEIFEKNLERLHSHNKTSTKSA